ncbi:MAG TPA: rhodanese-like domain-containing protein [Steroidobacteraceae bacterium]|nr:rhodanese-like domain-containing protein [Steroidobacteraceae bacterium]
MPSPFGLAFVFFNVLIEQLGAPVPAVPTLVVAGALAAGGRLPAAPLGALAVAACAIADGIWYVAGRRYGNRVLRLLCRISLSPDSCVNQTQTLFGRWGARTLLVAKFVPGLAIIAAPLAGATRMGTLRFVCFSLLGSTFWVSAALVLGALLRRQIAQLLPQAAHFGAQTLAVALLLLAAYIAYKWWERRRLYAALAMARISVTELRARIDGGATPVVVDVRSPTARTLELRRIPGALHLPLDEVERELGTLPRDREIIFYCNCPNEASAARAARLLMSHGFRRVRPLAGGLDAWIEAGYAVEPIPVSAVIGDSPAAPRPLA